VRVIKCQSTTSVRTFENAEGTDDDVTSGEVLECKQDTVVDLVGALHLLQDTNDEAYRHELA